MMCEDDEFHVFGEVDITDLYGFEFTRLTDVIRQHYSNFLEKQVTENYQKCYSSVKLEKDSTNSRKLADDEYHQFIEKAVKILEDKALNACMVAQLYQRAMMKIITGVKRCTQQKRLILQLTKLLNDDVDLQHKSFSHKQNEQTICSPQFIQSMPKAPEIHIKQNDEDKILGNEAEPKLSLEEKIEDFKKKFCVEEIESNGNSLIDSNRTEAELLYDQQPKRPKLSPANESNNTTSPFSHLATAKGTTDQVPSQLPPENVLSNVKSNNDEYIDEIEMELARIFGEEKTELDELFGIDPYAEPDDPQIQSILKEIENAKINVDNHKDTATSLPAFGNCLPMKNEASHESAKPKNLKHHIRTTSDLSKSLWPCELFMLRRKLSETLAYLIDEDYRWLDIIKFEFSQLFGEDSDDEFATYSPSIELDEILIGSCMRRISSWVVKYLMKPLKDGLIANRFLFKKLAKHLTYSIIMENQYPDEAFIIHAVENYFCIHPSIMSASDINELNVESLLRNKSVKQEQISNGLKITYQALQEYVDSWQSITMCLAALQAGQDKYERVIARSSQLHKPSSKNHYSNCQH